MAAATSQRTARSRWTTWKTTPSASSGLPAASAAGATRTTAARSWPVPGHVLDLAAAQPEERRLQGGGPGGQLVEPEPVPVGQVAHGARADPGDGELVADPVDGGAH